MVLNEGKKDLSPQEVRAILNADNKEIVKLCRDASVCPKKNERGQTYFSVEEVDSLLKAKSARAAAKIVEIAERKAQTQETKEIKSKQNPAVINQQTSQLVVNNLLKTLKSFESNVTAKMSKVIDEKLDGLDDVVVDLIRCKTENENLRQKINELQKENYHLKEHLNRYKSVGFGFFVKKQKDDLYL